MESCVVFLFGIRVVVCSVHSIFVETKVTNADIHVVSESYFTVFQGGGEIIIFMTSSPEN